MQIAKNYLNVNLTNRRESIEINIKLRGSSQKGKVTKKN